MTYRMMSQREITDMVELRALLNQAIGVEKTSCSIDVHVGGGRVLCIWATHEDGTIYIDLREPAKT